MKYECKDCGSRTIFADRQVAGRLLCNKCGSFEIGRHDQIKTNKDKVIRAFNGTKVKTNDWQYLIVTATLTTLWLATDFLGIIDKNSWIFYSGIMIHQPHRFITNALIHMNGMHLLANIGGIIIARAILMQLEMRSKCLFALLVILLVPMSSVLRWTWEIIIISNFNSASLGFSGVIYGINAFLLLAAMKGKQKFLQIPINLKKNYQAQQTMLVLTILGQIYNFVGNVSVSGHQSGLIAGLLIFLL